MPHIKKNFSEKQILHDTQPVVSSILRSFDVMFSCATYINICHRYVQRDCAIDYITVCLHLVLMVPLVTTTLLCSFVIVPSAFMIRFALAKQLFLVDIVHCSKGHIDYTNSY